MNTFSPTIRTSCLIFLSFLLGVVLMFLRLPAGFDWFSPFWIVLMLLYWALMMPQYVNVGIAWFVGFILDMTYNSPIGEHAMALILLVFFINKFHHKIISFNFRAISLVVFGLIIFYQLLLFLMQSYVGNYFNLWSILGGAVVSALIWSPLALLLSSYQQKLHL